MKKGKNGYYVFSAGDDLWLRQNYLKVPIKIIAKRWNCADNVIARRLKKLDLQIPKELAEQRKKGSMFRKGHTPVNKGKKITEYMSPEAIQKSKKTRYKKGHKPANTKSGNGHISVRHDKRTGLAYQYIKIGDGNWRELHKHLWEEKYGKISKGQVLVFRDGNQMNCAIENLELISQAEHLRRNRKSHIELPEELQTAKKLINKLHKSQKNGKKKQSQ